MQKKFPKEIRVNVDAGDSGRKTAFSEFFKPVTTMKIHLNCSRAKVLQSFIFGIFAFALTSCAREETQVFNSAIHTESDLEQQRSANIQAAAVSKQEEDNESENSDSSAETGLHLNKKSENLTDDHCSETEENKVIPTPTHKTSHQCP